MKINEFRSLLANASSEDLIKVASEIYKALPKSLKGDSDYGIDAKIKMIIEHQDASKVAPKVERIDYESLHDEINTFTENAYDYNYIKQNRVVPKAQRSKWRFLVMRFIKDLQKIPSDDENYKDSILDLIELYKTLSYGCSFYIFKTDDPFASIGKAQFEYYEIICSRIFVNGFNKELLSEAIDAASMVSLDRVTLHIILIKILMEYIKERDDILYTIKTACEMIDKIKDELGDEPRHSFIISEEHILYDQKKMGIESIAALVMGLYMKLAEYDTGCEYYWKTCENLGINVNIDRDTKEKDKEILFYCLLDRLSSMSDNDLLWVRIYEKYRDQVDPRVTLVKKYEELKKSLS